MKRIIIVGGGISGLVSAVQLARAGNPPLVIEKKVYPFHRVCGEYISNETVPFLQRTGLYPASFSPSQISRFQLTSVNGKSALLPLHLGGFGISRYTFDQFLQNEALRAGVRFLLDTPVDQIQWQDGFFQVQTRNQQFEADIVIGAFGKRSTLDASINRSFIRKRSPYVGVKYHIRTEHPNDLIALHNFKNGYCGISNVEEGKTNLCYLTHRDNLKKYGNIRSMEEAVLFRNPFIKSIFDNCEFLLDKPETINEISFENKSPVDQHILMSGDAAGMITPLCGNGMAMAIHSSMLLSDLVLRFCRQPSYTREKLELEYDAVWKRLFENRLWAGRQIQRLFGSEWASNLTVNVANFAPPIANWLVGLTHGEGF